MLGLFGKTGSGKSTLVDIITGLLNLDSGEVIIDHNKFDKVPTLWQRNIGYIPQNIYLLDDSIKKNIALGVNDKNAIIAIPAERLPPRHFLKIRNVPRSMGNTTNKYN